MKNSNDTFGNRTRDLNHYATARPHLYRNVMSKFLITKSMYFCSGFESETIADIQKKKVHLRLSGSRRLSSFCLHTQPRWS